jgi:putative transposase
MSSVADFMVSEDTKKQSKKPEKNKIPKEITCYKCDLPFTFETNKFLCNKCTEENKDSLKCNGLKSDKTNCNYDAKHIGFCGHHIKIPKEIPETEKEYNTCRKIRLRPNERQKTLLKQWFGVSRLCYNKALAKSKKDKPKLDGSFRDSITKSLDSLGYCKIVPLKVKQESVNDLIKATNNAKLKYTKTNKFQNISYKTKFAPSHSININKDAITKKTDYEITIYPRTLGSIKYDGLLKEIPTHCRIVCKYNRYFYLCVPLEMKKEESKPAFEDTIVALDPGERTFNSFYSNSLCGHVGIKCRTRFAKLFNEYDKQKSKYDRYKNKLKKTTYKKKAKKLKNKMKALRKKYLSVISKPTRLAKELHQKTALFLCKNFDTILIPEFSCKKLSVKLRSVINRSNQALSHYSFRQRLLHTAKRYQRKVHIVPESYTSLTCTNCGNVSKKDSSESLTCGKCNLTMNRDLRGSRNILIKNMISIQNKIKC